MNWVLVFVPVAIDFEFLAPERHLLLFLTSSLAVLPLAGWLGHTTEQLAELLNATFGSAVELALAALRAGLHEGVDASISFSASGVLVHRRLKRE